MTIDTFLNEKCGRNVFSFLKHNMFVLFMVLF